MYGGKTTSTRRGFVCCKVAGPRRDPGDGCNESSSYLSRHCNIGGRRWRRVGHLQSCLRRARLQAQVPPVEKCIADLFPVHREGQEEGRGSERSIANISGIQASVRRRSGSGGEMPGGSAMRSGKVGCWSINGKWIRWSSCEAVSVGGLPHCDEACRNGCRGVMQISKRPLREDISRKWRGFLSSSPHCHHLSQM